MVKIGDLVRPEWSIENPAPVEKIGDVVGIVMREPWTETVSSDYLGVTEADFTIVCWNDGLIIPEDLAFLEKIGEGWRTS